MHIALAVVGYVVISVVPEPHVSTPPTGHAPVRVAAIGRDHRQTFLTAGVAAMSVGVLRRPAKSSCHCGPMPSGSTPPR